MKVPYNDLSRIHERLKNDILSEISQIIDQSKFINGEANSSFEAELGKVFGISNVVGCANGTDAILGALKALGVNRGDEIIVPSVTWASTAEVVSLAGATPVFCDVNGDTLVSEAEDIKHKITTKTKGIIIVHLYGNVADLDAINSLAREYNLWVIEDCAQAHLSQWGDLKVGNFGNVGTFSFFPGKNLGAFGDAGAVCSNDVTLSKYMRQFFNHGQEQKNKHSIVGTNSRLDNIQAAILLKKLQYIENWTSERIKIAKYYDQNILSNKFKKQRVHKKAVNSRHIYPLIVEQRENLIDYLERNNIGYNINYPTPVHKQPCFAGSNAITLQRAEYISRCTISLPIFPGMLDKEIAYVVGKLNDYR